MIGFGRVWASWRGSRPAPVSPPEAPAARVEATVAPPEAPPVWQGLQETLGSVADDTRRLGRSQVRLTAGLEGLKAGVDAQQDKLEAVLSKLHGVEVEQGRRMSALQGAVEELAWQGRAEWVRDLLPVLDGLRTAEALAGDRPAVAAGPRWRRRLAGWLAAPPPQQEGWVTGLGMLRERVEQVLETRGAREIPALGLPFNPETQVAVEVTEAAPPGMVHAVWRAGFLLDGRIVRPAEVVVGRTKGEHT